MSWVFYMNAIFAKIPCFKNYGFKWNLMRLLLTFVLVWKREELENRGIHTKTSSCILMWLLLKSGLVWKREELENRRIHTRASSCNLFMSRVGKNGINFRAFLRAKFWFLLFEKLKYKLQFLEVTKS